MFDVVVQVHSKRGSLELLERLSTAKASLGRPLCLSAHHVLTCHQNPTSARVSGSRQPSRRLRRNAGGIALLAAIQTVSLKKVAPLSTVQVVVRRTCGVELCRMARATSPRAGRFWSCLPTNGLLPPPFVQPCLRWLMPIQLDYGIDERIIELSDIPLRCSIFHYASHEMSIRLA